MFKISRLTTLFMALIVAVSLFSTAYLPLQASALSGSEFQAGRIMDDSIFFNGTTMSPFQIQNFLNSKVPVCDTWHAASGENVPPFTCLKDYRQDTPDRAAEPGLCSGFSAGNKAAAQIIYEVAMSCGVNPKVLLVLLQKEQSLVTDTWPWTIQYRSATGFGCPDTAPCDAEYYGFFNQVYNAARQFKKYARDASLFNYRNSRNNFILYNPNSSCGGSNVFITTQATAGLYNYTPYQPNQAALNNLYGTGDGCSAYGNRNFWRLYNDWFGRPTGTPILQGTTSTVFLVNNGVRYGVSSSEMLYNYGLLYTPVTPTSDSYLGSLADGGVLSSLFTIDGDPTVYVADGGRKIGIPSAGTCTMWGFDCTNGVKQVSYDVGASLADGGVLQPLLAYNNTVYKMQSGVRRPYLSAQAAAEDGADLRQVTVMTSSANIGNSVGAPIIENNALVRFPSNPTVFYYVNGHFYGIPDGNTFNNWFSRSFVNFDRVSSYAAGPPTITGTLSSLFKTTSGSTYLLNNGSRIDLTSQAGNWPAPLVASDLDSTVTSKPLAITFSSSNTLRTPDTALSIVADGKRQIFPTMNDFDSLGYSLNNLVNVNKETLDYLPVGPLAIGEGSVFKVNNDPLSIYLKGPSNTVYYLTTQDQLSQFQLTRIDPIMPASQLSIYSAPKALSTFVNVVGGSTYSGVVDINHKLWKFDSTEQARWGINPATASVNITENGAIYNPLSKTNAALPPFAVYNGTVYYGNGGVKHPIATQASYQNLGGNSSNTFFASKDFIDAAPTGSIL